MGLVGPKKPSKDLRRVSFGSSTSASKRGVGILLLYGFTLSLKESDADGNSARKSEEWSLPEKSYGTITTDLALYKYSHYLKYSADSRFDPALEPGTTTPHSGIYTCQRCGCEISPIWAIPCRRRIIISMLSTKATSPGD